MDPNRALELMREAIAHGDTEAAAEYAEALDSWLSRGGFLPTAWRAAR